MKFALIALIALVSVGTTQATVGTACDNNDDTECASGECCGWA